MSANVVAFIAACSIAVAYTYITVSVKTMEGDARRNVQPST